jgi:hypothetical protein
MSAAELADLYVFPCRADKSPACPHGFKDAVCERDKIAELFRRYPGELVGAPTGSINGFDILDIDIAKGGEDWLLQYECSHDLPPTRIVATRSGGLHLYFQHRVGLRCSAGLLAPGCDIRAEGGYVILWHLAAVLCEGPVAPWPVPMLELLHEAEEARRSMAANHLMGGTLLTERVAKATHELPKPLYFRMCQLMSGSRGLHQRRAKGLLSTLIEQRENRNHALNTLGFPFRELIEAGAISWDGAKELLIEAARLNGYIAKRGPAKAIRTIHSALGPPRTPGSHQIEEKAG